MAWILFYMVVCISRLIEFFVIIRPKYITDAKTFIHMREDLLHLNAEEIQAVYDKINDEQIEQYVKEERITQIKLLRGERLEPYIFQKRKYGEGELRIGDSILLSDSIYHYGYAISLQDDHINKFMDIIVGVVRKEGDDDEMTPDDNETITQLRLRYEEASGNKKTEAPRPSAFVISLNENEPLLEEESDESSSDDVSENGETQVRVRPVKP